MMGRAGMNNAPISEKEVGARHAQIIQQIIQAHGKIADRSFIEEQMKL
jgi:hypothetical protein